jgi:hypothetical protein
MTVEKYAKVPAVGRAALSEGLVADDVAKSRENNRRYRLRRLATFLLPILLYFLYRWASGNPVASEWEG